MSETKILVVDDSKVTRRSLTLLLEKKGYETKVLDNVEDLFSFAERYRDISLIILDINLPGMDGLTALQYMKQLSVISNIPVIILSGHSDMNNVRKALGLGAADYLIKPYIAEKLLARIEKILEEQ